MRSFKIWPLKALQLENFMRSDNNLLWSHTFPYQRMCGGGWIFSGNDFVNITLKLKLNDYDYNLKCNLSLEHCSLKDIGSSINKYCLPYETDNRDNC